MKTMKKTLALILALGCLLCMAACGNGGNGDSGKLDYKKPTQSVEHWNGYSYEDYAAEDVSSKTIAYQFANGSLDFSDYGITYNMMLNLYEDGFAKMIQYGPMTMEDGSLYEDVVWYYGNWEYDESNKVIGISLRFVEGYVVDEATYEATLDHHEDGFVCEAEIIDGVMYTTVPCDKYYNVFHDGSVEMTTEGKTEFASFDAFTSAKKPA